jgi:PleD family two-component response regulator
MQLNIAKMTMPLAVGNVHVTASLGISSYDPTDHAWETTLARADAALEEAKNSMARPADCRM